MFSGAAALFDGTKKTDFIEQTLSVEGRVHFASDSACWLACLHACVCVVVMATRNEDSWLRHTHSARDQAPRFAAVNCEFIAATRRPGSLPEDISI